MHFHSLLCPNLITKRIELSGSRESSQRRWRSAVVFPLKLLDTRGLKSNLQSRLIGLCKESALTFQRRFFRAPVQQPHYSFIAQVELNQKINSVLFNPPLWTCPLPDSLLLLTLVVSRDSVCIFSFFFSEIFYFCFLMYDRVTVNGSLTSGGAAWVLLGRC